MSTLKWTFWCFVHLQLVLLSCVFRADGEFIQLKFNYGIAPLGIVSAPVIRIEQERKVSCPDDDVVTSPTVCNWDSGDPCDEVEEEFNDPLSIMSTAKECYETIQPELANETANTLLCQPRDRIKLKCESNYLTRWNTTILPTKDAKYKESQRYDQNPFKSDNLTFVTEFELVIEDGTSGWMRCEYIDKTAPAFELMKSEIYIFAQAGSFLVGDAKEESVLLEDLNAPLEVPCIANYPHVEAILEQEAQHFRYEPVSPSRIVGKYDPRYGFVVQGTNETEQTYRCVAEYQNVLFYYKKIERLPDEIGGQTSKEELTLYTGSLDENHEEKRLDIFCRSDGPRSQGILFLKMIRCKSPLECDWLSACFDKCWLNHDVEKQEVTQTSGLPLLKNPYPTGIALCTFPQETIVKRNYYFVGLDRLSYFVSDSIPKNALIRLDTNEQHFYTYQSTEFSCSISTFLLISNIKFAVMFKNRTKALLDTIDPNGDQDLEEFEERGFSQRKIAVNLTVDMTLLICMAPYFNSTEWLEASIPFNTKDVELPKIDQFSENAKRTVRLGEQLLPCSAKGDPKPTISWVFPNKKIESKVKYTNDLEGESTLAFLTVDKSFEGTYRCIARNEFNETSFDFYVEIDDSSFSIGGIIGFVMAGIIFLLLLMVLIYFAIKYHLAGESMRDLTEDEINYFQNGSPNQLNSELLGPEVAKGMAFDSAYIIDEKDLIIVKQSVLGEGEYGTVYRGFWHGDAVAVKTTKSCADVSYVKSLLVELKIMAYIGHHPHVVTFNGAVVSRIKERIVFVVVELCPLGNLHAYLRKISGVSENLDKLSSVRSSQRKSNNISADDCRVSVTTVNYAHSTRNLIDWFKQIADGMDFLSRKKVVHGDLAARNILVFRNEVMKITDFGLSRQMYGYCKYVKKQEQSPLPWRWMAIESLRLLEFSSQSDVWAFAVTMWEIFTMGETPFPGQNWTFDFIDEVVNGLRLPIPKNAPKNIYDVMLACWNLNHTERPTFAVLRDYFDSLLKTSTDYGYNK